MAGSESTFELTEEQMARCDEATDALNDLLDDFELTVMVDLLTGEFCLVPAEFIHYDETKH